MGLQLPVDLRWTGECAQATAWFPLCRFIWWKEWDSSSLWDSQIICIEADAKYLWIGDQDPVQAHTWIWIKNLSRKWHQFWVPSVGRHANRAQMALCHVSLPVCLRGTRHPMMWLVQLIKPIQGFQKWNIDLFSFKTLTKMAVMCPPGTKLNKSQRMFFWRHKLRAIIACCQAF